MVSHQGTRRTVGYLWKSQRIGQGRKQPDPVRLVSGRLAEREIGRAQSQELYGDGSVGLHSSCTRDRLALPLYNVCRPIHWNVSVSACVLLRVAAHRGVLQGDPRHTKKLAYQYTHENQRTIYLLSPFSTGLAGTRNTVVYHSGFRTLMKVDKG